MVLGGLTTVLTCLGVVSVVVMRWQESSRRLACTNHLRLIGFSLKKYAGVHGTFPAATHKAGDLPPPRRISWLADVLPLLNNVDLIADQARKHMVWLHLFSNGTLLTLERYEKIRDRLHKLWISLDAGTQDTFEKIRVPAKWERLTACLELLSDAKKAARSKTPGLRIIFTWMKSNRADLAALPEFAADHGAEELDVRFVSPTEGVDCTPTEAHFELL